MELETIRPSKTHSSECLKIRQCFDHLHHLTRTPQFKNHLTQAKNIANATCMPKAAPEKSLEAHHHLPDGVTLGRALNPEPQTLWPLGFGFRKLGSCCQGARMKSNLRMLGVRSEELGCLHGGLRYQGTLLGSLFKGILQFGGLC